MPDMQKYYTESVLPVLQERRDLWPEATWCSSAWITIDHTPTQSGGLIGELKYWLRSAQHI